MKKYIITLMIATGLVGEVYGMTAAKAADAAPKNANDERTRQFVAASKLDVANLTPALAGHDVRHDVQMRAKVRLRRLSGDYTTNQPWLSADAVITDAAGYADLAQKQKAIELEEEKTKKDKQEKLESAPEVRAKLQKHSAMLVGTCGAILYMWKHDIIERLAYKFGPFVGGLLPQAVIGLLLHNLINKVWAGGNQYLALPDEVAAYDRKLAALATQKAQLAKQKVESLVPALKIGISPVKPQDWYNPKQATPEEKAQK